MMRGKKGNVMDILDSFGISVSLIITVLIVGIILWNFQSNAASIPAFSGTESQANLAFMADYGGLMDWVVLAVYFITLIFSIIAARAIPSSVYFMVMGVIVSLFITATIIFLSRFLQEMLAQAALTNIVSQLTIIPFFVNYSVYFALLYMFLTLLALYAGKDD